MNQKTLPTSDRSSFDYKNLAEAEEKYWWFVARRRIVREMVRHLEAPSLQKTIVDVGCGTGANAAALAKDYRCIGVDYSEEAIRLARLRFPGVPFFCGAVLNDFKELMEPASVFLLLDVLEHIEEDRMFLESLLKVARPGSHFLITVPADPRLWGEYDVRCGHYRRYEPDRLASLWKGQPVTARLLSYFCMRLYPAIWAFRAIHRFRGRRPEVAREETDVPPAPLNLLLERIFFGESKVLVELLEGRRQQGFSFGSSLMAVLRREEG